MRLITLALATLAILAASASASSQYYDAQSQDDVKNLRWANCSTVVHGRLGDLHKYGDSAWHMVRQNPEFLFAYSPCNGQTFDQLLAVGEGGYSLGWESVDFAQFRPADVLDHATKTWVQPTFFWVLFRKVQKTWGTEVLFSLHNGTATDFANNQKLTSFHMPSSKGEVPHFTADFTTEPIAHEKAIKLKPTVTVTVNCGADDSDFVVNVTADESKNSLVTLQSREACARFPYTNEAMPSGGIAALVVVILCFVIQFSICGWYHATHKLDVNPADRDYSSME